ncbi:MAG: HU family DNA-binding protein [Bacteroidota bacterium]|nr:HU family DNA-binding protein [Bacteroidota bacterium]MDE2835527.1 HU family DNA-binding protein [Bacteroidota bacterium]MDE2957002.1 HU family DNA-binding protein [Bacteroidota bacterium]
MDTFAEVGQRAMKALAKAIRDGLVRDKEVHVDGLGTFRIVDQPARFTHSAQETKLTPPSRKIAFKAESPGKDG